MLVLTYTLKRQRYPVGMGDGDFVYTSGVSVPIPRFLTMYQADETCHMLCLSCDSEHAACSSPFGVAQHQSLCQCAVSSAVHHTTWRSTNTILLQTVASAV